jgi:DNA polymerase V
MKKAVLELFDKIVDEKLLVRRVNLSANHIVYKAEAEKTKKFEQLDLFTAYEETEKEIKAEERELKLQEATVEIRRRYGKNAVIKGINLQEGATTLDRNKQIGGHKA